MVGLIIAISVTAGMMGIVITMSLGGSIALVLAGYMLGGMLGAYAAISMAWRAYLQTHPK